MGGGRYRQMMSTWDVQLCVIESLGVCVQVLVFLRIVVGRFGSCFSGDRVIL